MSTSRDRGEAAVLIGQLGQLLGPACQLHHAQEREWASATFAGRRHQLLFAVGDAQDGDALARTLHALPDHEFTLPTSIVADCTATWSGGTRSTGDRLLLIELLTVDAD